MDWPASLAVPRESALLAIFCFRRVGHLGLPYALAGHEKGAAVRRLCYDRGSTVRVRLFDTRVLQGEVKAILETSSGRKVRILSGACVLTVRAEQVIRVIKAVG